MVLSAKKSAPSFLRNGPLFPTANQIKSRLEPIKTHLTGDASFAVESAPIYAPEEISPKLLELMYNNFNNEIKTGTTYPQYEAYETPEEFAAYWFHSFTCILIKNDGSYSDVMEFIKQDADWEEYYLGSFYIKPNYAGRCSHVCNAGFFIPPKYRGYKISYRLGQMYLKYAPKLGYSQSIYNLVYATNIGSWKTWDRLKFQRIGVVPNVAVLGAGQVAVTDQNYQQYDYQYTDAYIYSKNLLEIEEELFSDL